MSDVCGGIRFEIQENYAFLTTEFEEGNYIYRLEPLPDRDIAQVGKHDATLVMILIEQNNESVTFPFQVTITAAEEEVIWEELDITQLIEEKDTVVVAEIVIDDSAYFAIPEIQGISKSGLVVVRFNETVHTRSTFNLDYQKHMRVRYV